MGYLKDMYGQRGPEFIEGMLAILNEYSVWRNGVREIGSPEKDINDIKREIRKDFGYEDVVDYGIRGEKNGESI